MYSPSTPFSEYLQIEQIKYPELTFDAIETLKRNTKDNINLPPISDKMYLAFLHSCYFDVELAKKTIEIYYSIHFDIPEVFCNLDPLQAEIKQFCKCVSISAMPSTNIDKNDRIVYTQFIDENPALLECVPGYKYMTMWMQYMLLTYGTCDGIIVVANTNGLSWRHIIKLPIAMTIKLLRLLELGLPIRWKKLHVLNAGTAAYMLYKMIAKFADPLLMEKIIMHPVGSEDVFNHISRDMLPSEVGGTGKSHNHFQDDLYNGIICNRNVYLEQNEILNNQMMYMNQQLFDDNY